MSEPGVDGADEPGFDEVLVRLEEVVSKLEQGNLSLEEALRSYEEGIGLARRGHEVLDGAEKRVELLIKQDQAGETSVPLDAAEMEGEGGSDGGDR